MITQPRPYRKLIVAKLYLRTIKALTGVSGTCITLANKTIDALDDLLEDRR